MTRCKFIVLFILAATTLLFAHPSIASAGSPMDDQILTDASPSSPTHITIGLPGAWDVHPPEILAQFEKAHPHIKVETIALPWDGFFDRLLLMLVTGTAPDVWYGEAGRAARWYDAGFTMDLKPLVDRDLDLDDYFFLHAAEDPATLAWTGIPSDFQVTSLFYNTEHFNTSGLPFPDESWTRDDLLEAARLLTRSDLDSSERWGFSLQPEYITAGWMLWIKWLGGHILDGTRQHSLLNETATIEALEQMQALIYERGISPPPGVHGFTPWSTVDTFHRGSTSMMFNIYTWNRYLYDGDMHTYDVAMIPPSEDGEPLTTAVPNVWVINRQSDEAHREAAWEWVKFQIGDVAQSIRMAKGTGVPVNRHLAWHFAELPAPPHNRRIYLDSYAFSVTLEENAVWDEYRMAIEESFRPLWYEEKTAVDVALDAHSKVERILRGETT